MSAFDTANTVGIHKDVTGTPSTASLTITKKSDGSYEFTDTNGVKVILHSHRDDALKRLFDTINALV